jgi:hypothetical protein
MVHMAPVLTRSVFRYPVIFFAACFFTLIIGSSCGTIPSETGTETAYNSNDRGDQVLNRYGAWITVNQYGRVWQPNVGASWAPYTEGEWVYSDQGWFWESDEPFGWLVYHYGNWNYSDDIGWFWVPSEEWAASRVQWTEFGEYIGWAPYPAYGAILPEPWTPEGGKYWIVVPVKKFTDAGVIKHKVVRNVNLLSAGKDISLGRPPDPVVIEKITKRKIVQVEIKREPVTGESHVYQRATIKESPLGNSAGGKESTSKKEKQEQPAKQPIKPATETEGHKRGEKEVRPAGTSDSTKVVKPRR